VSKALDFIICRESTYRLQYCSNTLEDSVLSDPHSQNRLLPLNQQKNQIASVERRN